MSVTVYHGHAPDVLATLEPGSVHLACTSPPYWGLRAYGTEAQVWDGDPACAHEWGETVRAPWANAVPGPAAWSTNPGKNPEARIATKQAGSFCARCGAWKGELGQEPSPELYVAHLVDVFRAVRPVLKPAGVLLLNLGDTYWNDPGGQNGSTGGVSAKAIEANRQNGRLKRERHLVLKRKDLVGIPWRVAFALQADGWYLRGEYVWHKPNALPESVTDRCTKAHEQVFHLTKSADYYWDADAIAEPAAWERWGDQTVAKVKPGEVRGSFIRAQTKEEIRERFGGTKNKRSVWTIPTESFAGAHFAVMPEALVKLCVLAGSPEGGTVLDPFGGSGTVGVVADRLGRDAVLIDLNGAYVAMAERRIRDDSPLFVEVETASLNGVRQLGLFDEVSVGAAAPAGEGAVGGWDG